MYVHRGVLYTRDINNVMVTGVSKLQNLQISKSLIQRRNILFQIGHFSAFLHNSYGTSEFPDFGNLTQNASKIGCFGLKKSTRILKALFGKSGT